ncbi:MAG: DUF2157 domain-containing protein [Parvularculaceae bacterium]|jgi:hypothetical protein|nr:DUF2157 domain-containing protein [Parvularculaceae bacterium]
MGDTPQQRSLDALARWFAGAQSGDVRARGASPDKWAFALFIFFGAAQLISAAIMFFAYNWRELSDLTKIALPQGAMAISFLAFAALPKRSLLGQVAGVAATVMIGVSMAVLGQVYQLGADPWPLFAIWAAFALPLALIARSDALFGVWFVIASTAFMLWGEEILRPRFGFGVEVVPASYAVLAFAVLLMRDFAASIAAGPQPNWQRWLFLASALVPATFGALDEALADKPFESGVYGTLALAVVGGGALLFYGVVRNDRPARALALFAIAVFAGGVGVRTVWRLDLDSIGEIAFGFLLSAVWVVGVTAVLARLLRPRGGAS